MTTKATVTFLLLVLIISCSKSGIDNNPSQIQSAMIVGQAEEINDLQQINKDPNYLITIQELDELLASQVIGPDEYDKLLKLTQK